MNTVVFLVLLKSSIIEGQPAKASRASRQQGRLAIIATRAKTTICMSCVWAVRDPSLADRRGAHCNDVSHAPGTNGRREVLAAAFPSAGQRPSHAHGVSFFVKSYREYCCSIYCTYPAAPFHRTIVVHSIRRVFIVTCS